MKRVAVALVLALATLTSPAVPAAQAEASAFVTWTVNHKAKTITVNARLAIYLDDCVASAGVCSVPPSKIATDIKTDIEAVWNPKAKNYRYKCYRLIFRVDVTVVGDRFEVPNDRVGVLIDRSSGGIRSSTTNTLTSGLISKVTSNYLSNDPADRIEPANNVAVPSEFSYPSISKHSYSHEYGHVLGLDHYYDEDTSELLKGAPADVMWNANLATISQESIDRVIERNRDRLVDTKGNSVELKDLVCDLQFMATLKADQVHYDAINVRDNRCGPQAFSASTDQSLRVDTASAVQVSVIEDPTATPLGYNIFSNFDAFAIHSGLAGGSQGIPSSGTKLFDVPVSVEVTRFHNEPASGDEPILLEFTSEICPGGSEGNTPPPSDCGKRGFPSWLAIEQSGLGELWTAMPNLPNVIKDLGYSDYRLNKLYKNCQGPTPWPGLFVEEGEATVTKGKLPALDALKTVAHNWFYDGTPGRITITGTAVVDISAAGSLKSEDYEWTLTLCPLNGDGQTPPDCP